MKQFILVFIFLTSLLHIASAVEKPDDPPKVIILKTKYSDKRTNYRILEGDKITLQIIGKKKKIKGRIEKINDKGIVLKGQNYLFKDLISITKHDRITRRDLWAYIGIGTLYIGAGAFSIWAMKESWQLIQTASNSFMGILLFSLSSLLLAIAIIGILALVVLLFAFNHNTFILENWIVTVS